MSHLCSRQQTLTAARALALSLSMVAPACSGMSDVMPTGPSSMPQASPVVTPAAEEVLTRPAADRVQREASGLLSAAAAPSTGSRRAYCANVNYVTRTNWVPIMDGLDVKLSYDPNFKTAQVHFRNRYGTTIHFGFAVYPYGIKVPDSNYRRTLAAGRAQGGAIGTGMTKGIDLGGKACVVVDRVRFGAKDSGPYFTS